MDKPFRLPLKKRIFTHPWFQDASSWLMARILKLLWLTFRVTRHASPEAQPYLDGDMSAIFCFWHGRMILFPFFRPKGRQVHVLISFHRDGELISKVIGHFGVHSTRGSSSKGALDATKAIRNLLDEGHNVVITPDGPRGPARVAAKGAVYLAKLSNKPVIPVAFSSSKFKALNSWDKFMIPLPFSHIVLEVGAPIFIEAEAEKSMLESYRSRLQEELNHLTDRADQQV